MSGPGVEGDASCLCADFDHDNEVTLGDYAFFQGLPPLLPSIALQQEPGFGYCPEVGAVSRVDVIMPLDGDFIMNGTTVVEGDPLIDKCIFGGFECFTEIAFPPQTLTALEVQQFSALLDAIPAEGCDTGCTDVLSDPCCIVVDPCQINTICNGLQSPQNDFCYGCGNSKAYRRAIQDLFDFVTDLVNE